MDPTTLADPYPNPFVWDEIMAHEYPEHWAEGFTDDDHTRLELLDYDNPVGLHPREAIWRDLARKLKRGIGRSRCACEGGWLPLLDGSFVECHACRGKE